jgi:succinate-acetate transporter protein
VGYSANFTITEFYEVGRAALVTFSTSWCLIHRLVLSSGVTKRQSNRSRRKGNTIGWVVWALMSVMLLCLVLWAATGAVPLLFAAVLAGLRVLYMVLLINR